MQAIPRTLAAMVLVTLMSLPGALGAEPPSRPATQGGESQGQEALQKVREQRYQAAHHKRRIIFNNDGCDALYFPTDQAPTPDNLLAIRTTPLLGSQVDTLFYCTVSSGFSLFTHNTKVGEVFAWNVAPTVPTEKNMTLDLIAQGTDPLKIMVEFCRKHNLEVFWSMRMNDTHDGQYTGYSCSLFPRFKREHPERLVSAGGDPITNALQSWAAVDYAQPVVRDMAFRLIEEVCQNYDVDGVELDFFRHPVLLREPARGQAASQAELDLITDLMRRLRTMTDEEGARRGKPILISIRVPDSIEYCRWMGIDLDRWLSEGLVDILTATDYFQLNPWEYLVKLGHKYDIPVYPCLSDARVGDETGGDLRRNSPPGYRGRAMNVWQAGADGVYIYNLYDAAAPFLSDIGDPKTLAPCEKVYYGSPLGSGQDGPTYWVPDLRMFQKVCYLNPSEPMTLAAEPQGIELMVGDDPSAGVAAGHPPTLTLHLQITGLTSAEGIAVTVNDTRLEGGVLGEESVEFPVPPAAVRPGSNAVQFALAVPTSNSVKLKDVWLHYVP